MPSMRSVLVPSLLAASLLAAGCPRPAPRPTLPEERGNAAKSATGTPSPQAPLYRITDAGEVYSAIYTTDCLRWPSEQARLAGGPPGWGSYYPADGDTGALVATTKHCRSGATIHILQVGANYVAIGASGVEAAGGAGGAASGEQYRITDDGQTYPSINQTECLTWPSEEIRKRAGDDAWGGWEPSPGDVGTLVARTRHCDSGIAILILKIGERYVPVGESGVERVGAGGGVAPAPGGTGTSGRGPARLGATYRITDEGELYTTINNTDCLTWPSADIKRQAGAASWGSYTPHNGDVGTLAGSSTHCDQPSVTVYILKIGANYVPIGSRGVEEVTGGGGGGAGPAPTPRAAPRVGAAVRITDSGKVYSAINQTDCLTWPSEEAKRKGGMDAWGAFAPKNGDTGTLAGTSAHCNGATTIYIVKIGEYYVAIGADGVEEVTGGGGAGFGQPGPPPGPQPGARFKITDTGEVYSTINEVDCLRWPSDDVKRQAGQKAWGRYSPQVGDVGTLVGTSPHCSSAATTVYILKVGEHHVPIGQDGVEPAP